MLVKGNDRLYISPIKIYNDKNFNKNSGIFTMFYDNSYFYHTTHIEENLNEDFWGSLVIFDGIYTYYSHHFLKVYPLSFFNKDDRIILGYLKNGQIIEVGRNFNNRRIGIIITNLDNRVGNVMVLRLENKQIYILGLNTENPNNGLIRTLEQYNVIDLKENDWRVVAIPKGISDTNKIYPLQLYLLKQMDIPLNHVAISKTILGFKTYHSCLIFVSDLFESQI
jgi:hypothetical protein